MFFTQLVPRNCLVKTDCFSFTSTKSLSGLWLTLYHVQLTALTWQVANLLLICAWIVTLETCSTLLKNSSKWLVEEMMHLLMAPNLIRHVLLELSTLCPSLGEKILETLDVETSDNDSVSIHVFHPLGAQKSVLMKTDSFPLTSTNSMSSLWLSRYHVKSMAPTWKFENLLPISAWNVTFRLIWLFWKTLWGG